MSDVTYALYAGLCACVVSLACLFLALRLFPKLGLLDFPERYGLSRARIPYPTGVVAWLVFLLFFLAAFPFGLQEKGLAAAVMLLGIVSFIDDRKPLPPLLRLAVQIAICLIVFVTGSRIYTITNPAEVLGFGSFLMLDQWTIDAPLFGSLPVLSGIFTVIWLCLTMNALNWFDGISGQVSVLSTIGFVVLAALALSDRVDQPSVAILCCILAGISVSCLVFDFPPPRMLLGDSGAMFFGFLLGVIGIYQGGKVATAFLVLGIPLFDALFVAIRRIMNGHSPFRGNLDHLHHRLLRKGWSPRAVVLLTACIGSLFGISALFMDTTEKGIAFILLFLLLLMLTRYSRSTSRS